MGNAASDSATPPTRSVRPAPPSGGFLPREDRASENSLQFKDARIFRNPANLRKESLALSGNFELNFRFDALGPTKVEVFVLASCLNSEISSSEISESSVFPEDGLRLRETFSAFLRGLEALPKKALEYRPGSAEKTETGEKWPLVIRLVSLAPEFVGVSQTSFCTISDVEGAGLAVHVVRQRLAMKSRSFEYYDVFEDGASECVVCLSETRQVAVLPCRHLCLCRGCAEVIRSSQIHQQKCPICRSMASRLLAVGPFQ